MEGNFMLDTIKVPNPEFKPGDWVYDLSGDSWYQLQEMDITSGMVYIPDKIFTDQGKVKAEDVYPTLFHIHHPIIKHLGIQKPRREIKVWIGVGEEEEDGMIKIHSQCSENRSDMEEISKDYNLKLNLQEVQIVLQ
jgi:hypothetical protein